MGTKFKQIFFAFVMATTATSFAEISAAYCHKTADYFTEFYPGLHKMYSHGFKNFSDNTVDQQA